MNKTVLEKTFKKIYGESGTPEDLAVFEEYLWLIGKGGIEI